MIRPIITLRRKRIIVDIDTQNDFFLANGGACVRNHRRVLANIRRIVAWARLKNIRTISTTQIYNDDNGHQFCLAGTSGQKKLSYTIRHRHRSFAADGSTDFPREILKEYDQIILSKRCIDPFGEPRADRMLSELRVDEFILFGAITDGAIKATALGLLARRKTVTILVDAIGSRDKAASEIALRKMAAKGAKLIDSKTFLGHSSLRLVGICDCDRCQGRMQKVTAHTNI